ncbi:MAG: hypothetical protein JWO82_2160 [Akkermansiaceae bacterium]|nr:hypothetical protein [Akkermansiaceae bacterium]
MKTEQMTLPGGTTILELEAALVQECPHVECPVIHRFAPGLYIREILMPPGTMATSMEHKTEHAFHISRGVIKVMSETEGSVTYRAPYWGLTKPGTKRVLFIDPEFPENAGGAVWITFHVTEHTDVDKIAEEILVPHDNPLIPEDQRNQWRNQNPKLEN